MSALDPRSERIALVAEDELVAQLPALRAGRYGVMQLPPAALAPDVAAEALAQLAEQVAEYSRNGYEVVLAGTAAPWRDELERALGAVGVAPLPPARV